MLNLKSQKVVTVLWLTGLSAAGKTTTAKLLKKNLEKSGLAVLHLDGNNFRSGRKNRRLGFLKSDRDTNIRLAIAAIKRQQKRYDLVIASFISPFRRHRSWARKTFAGYVEIFVDAPLKVCELRDPGGLYKKARRGLIKDFTGVSQTYEKPLRPEIRLQTGRRTPDQCVRKILSYLAKKRKLQINF